MAKQKGEYIGKVDRGKTNRSEEAKTRQCRSSCCHNNRQGNDREDAQGDVLFWGEKALTKGELGRNGRDQKQQEEGKKRYNVKGEKKCRGRAHPIELWVMLERN